MLTKYIHTTILLGKNMSSNEQQASPPCFKEKELTKEMFVCHSKKGSQDQAQFEKNYPKNIFIPLLQYLGELGYRETYEQSVGKRSEFEGKNVVSLGSIHQLISQDWFQRNINRQLALSHISNKILLNSKIKKKLFHLLIAQLIFTCDFMDAKDFRRKISKEAISISRRPLPEDPLFTYPNAIIYLLHLFRRILLSHASKKNFSKLEQDFEKMSLEEVVPEAKSKALGSKEQYKFYVKEIVHIFGSKSIAVQNYADILEEVLQTILQKDKMLREKYKLVQGIPNWTHFLTYVVMRCFEYRKKDLKLTNFLFNEWIGECKSKMLSISENKKESGKEGEEKEKEQAAGWEGLKFHDKWSALPLPMIPSGEGQSSKPVVKEFSPIILATNIQQ